MAKQGVFSGLVNAVNGIIVEILAALLLMGAVFAVGILLIWASK